MVEVHPLQNSDTLNYPKGHNDSISAINPKTLRNCLDELIWSLSQKGIQAVSLGKTKHIAARINYLKSLEDKGLFQALASNVTADAPNRKGKDTLSYLYCPCCLCKTGNEYDFKFIPVAQIKLVRKRKKEGDTMFVKAGY